MRSRKSLKPRLAALSAAAAIALGAAAPAQAFFSVVLDPSNLAQNILTALNTLEQLNNQIEQLQNEARMLSNQAQMLGNQARNLAGLDFNALGRLQSTLAETNGLIRQAEGLAFDVNRMQADFRRLYPESFAAVSADRMVVDAQARWRNALEALRTATAVQSQAMRNFEVDEQVLADLVGRSQSATGNLQATQATNQLLALQARQAIQAQQLQLTQGRAAAVEQARQVAVHERAREVRRRFMGSGTPYTPYTVNFYGSR